MVLRIGIGSRRFSSWRTRLEPLAMKAGSIRGTVGIPTRSSADNNHEAQSHAAISRKKRPLVVLSGWALAKRKHLHKYSDIYNSLGYPTLCIMPSLRHVLKLSSNENYSSDVMQILEKTYNGPIVFHLFSISSTILLPYITGIAVANNRTENIQLKGIIFDSGPIFYCHETAIAAASNLMEEGRINKLPYYFFITCSFLLEALQVAKKTREEFSEVLKRQALAVPQLYLYSDRDPVTPVEWVEKVMGEQRGLGRTVEGVMFQGANHVKLLQSDPVKYINLITSFLNKIQ